MIARWFGGVCAALAALASYGQPEAVHVPEALEDWRDWVLHGEEHRLCPFLYNSHATNRGDFVCAWSGELELDIGADGGQFEQTVTIYGDEQWLALPGDDRLWPQDVTVDGRPVRVLLREDAPAIRLAPGSHRIAGAFVWDERPPRLQVPAHAGLVALSVDGEAVPVPRRGDDEVWLGAGEREEQVEDALQVRVFRRLIDQVPTRLETVLEIDISGSVREERVAPALPAGFVPLALSSELPARLDADGSLRLQARPGAWDVRIAARADDVLDGVAMAAPQENLPDTEIWSYQAVPRLRATLPEGPPPVDPSQVDAPWAELPAFRLTSGESLAIVERSRGKTDTDNELTLRRDLWLDFDGSGFVFADHVSGAMRTGWRLDLAAPYALLGATERGRDLLVTRNPALDGGQETAGVEVRHAAMDVRGLGRIETRGAMPATGWLTEFAQVEAWLRVPPGHKLLAAVGVDSAPSSWLERWRLLDIFVLLIVTAAAVRLFGWRVGVIALLAVGLSYHEPAAPIWTWLNLLAAVALTRVAPEGRLQRAARSYRVVSLVLLALFLIPFLVGQIRFAVYPQLEPESYRSARTVGWFELLAGRLWTDGDGAAPEEMVVSGEYARKASADGSYKSVEAAPVAFARAERDVITRQDFDLPSPRDTITDFDLEMRADEDPAVEHFEVSGAAIERSAAGHADDALLQVGPGRPDWHWTTYALGWSGPVDFERGMRLLILPDWLVSILRLLGAGLLGAFAALFVFETFGGRLRLPSWLTIRQAAGGGAAAVLVAVVVLGAPATTAHADTPPADVLRTLKDRLTEPPACTPRCAEIVDADVVAGQDELTARLQVHAAADVAVPMPGSPYDWQPTSITGGDGAALATHRDANGILWVHLAAGRHELELRGPLPTGNSVEIPFSLEPRAIAARSEHWHIDGVQRRTLESGALILTRLQQSADAELGDAAAPPDWEASRIPAFLRVERAIMLDLQWTVATLVRRVAPRTGAIDVEIPLLDGEAVRTADRTVVDGRLKVTMAPTQRTFAWNSTLPTTERMTLRAPAGEPWQEVWSINVGGIWQAAFEGVPENDSGGAVTDGRGRILGSAAAFPHGAQFHPRPGEQLDIGITRPAATPGNTLAFDRVTVGTAVGAQRRSTTLSLSYRSSRGASHAIGLPAGADLQSVFVDGEEEPIALADGALDLPILPGQHTVHVAWDEDAQPGLRVRTPVVELDAPSSNIVTSLEMPTSRWLLFATGPSLGPAILYWSELIALLAVAVVLGRVRSTPLKTRHWILLGLGFSTFSWLALLVVALWLLAHGARPSWAPRLSRRMYNATQVGLGLLTLAAFAALLTGIPAGLLGTPDMHVAGFQSSGQSLTWFADQTNTSVPEASVWSLPLWTYKALTLVWALWLSLALVRWLPWVWGRFVEQGLWRKREPAPADDAGDDAARSAGGDATGAAAPTG